MFTVDHFLKEYNNYTDEQLQEMYLNREDYSEEANQAMLTVIRNRGGLNRIAERLMQKQLLLDETERIRTETAKIYTPGIDSAFVKKWISSSLFSPEQIDEIVREKLDELESEKRDKEVRPQTIYGSLIGGVLASTVGGVLWGLQLIQMHRIMFILLIGLVILSYGLIKLFTKQSRANRVVLVTTILSVIASLIIGQFLFEMFG